MSTPTPAVSVVMPAHNVGPYVEASVESILGQTFADFELVVFENGSTDETGEVLARLASGDARMRVITQRERLGHDVASITVTAASSAPVVARMDGDDVAHARRLERQLEALERRRDAVLVGTLWEGIDPHGRRVRPRDRSPLLQHALESPFPHGSIMFRREAYDAIGGYRELEGWADLDLFQRMGERGVLLVVPEALYQLRFHADSTTVRRAPDVARRVTSEKQGAARKRFPAARASLLGPAQADLEALYSESAMRLWRHERPALLREVARRRLLRQALRRPGLLAWGAAAAVSPGLLRSALRVVLLARDRMAARRLPSGEAVEWRFG